MRHLRAGLAGLFVLGTLTVIAPASTAAPPPKDLCAGMQRIALPGPDMCTRGPDTFPGMHPAKANKPMPADVARAQVLANPIVCEGDGVAGKRVEVMYAREQGQASRYAKFLPTLRAWSHEIDAAVNDSAAQTGASRHVRWVTEPAAGGCQVKVIEVVLPVGALESWEAMIPALQNAGFNRGDRKYAVYADAEKVCGVATLWGDDRPGLDNANNVNNGYARVDYGCWGFNAMGHELGHNFGAVQSSAPNYNGHCKDEWDLMCYGSDTTVVCTNKDQDRLFDCNHDDYFHTDPPAGSYLATHWNTARSDWLIQSATPDPREGPRHGQAYTLTNVGTGNAIDVVNSSPDNLAYVSHRAPSGATSQRWRFVYETGWLLQNVNSGKCADSAFSGTEPGTQILQYNCNGQQGMRWNLYPLADGSYGVLNTLTGHAVTDSGGYPEPLRQQPFDENAVPDTQKWRLVVAPEGDRSMTS